MTLSVWTWHSPAGKRISVAREKEVQPCGNFANVVIMLQL
jgi:hypothetical protein